MTDAPCCATKCHEGPSAGTCHDALSSPSQFHRAGDCVPFASGPVTAASKPQLVFSFLWHGMAMGRISILIVAMVFAGSGCSRTGLDDDDFVGALPDASFLDGSFSADSPIVDARADVTRACGPTNCVGCCDAEGKCQAGTSDSLCGANGSACDGCTSPFHCNSQLSGRACGSKIIECSVTNCPTGCCARSNNVSQDLYCFQGTDAYACGIGGQACADCTAASQACSNHACTGSVCGGGHCDNGCCLGSECVAGTDLHACGTKAAACEDCAALGDTCQQQQCKPPVCSPTTCVGCCVGDICAIGTQDSACGSGGMACADCTSLSESCTAQSCH